MTVVAVVLCVVSSVIAYLDNRQARKQEELSRFKRLDTATLEVLVRDVEAIRAKLGRAPKDRKELEEILGMPIPKIHDVRYPIQINYLRTGDNSFMLQYELWETDDWTYDSKKPNAGWVQHFY